MTPPSGGVAGGDALREGDHVGLEAVPDRAEPLAEPAEAADHLVRDEQDAVPVADLAHARPSTRAAGVKQPPEFCTGSAIIIAIDSGALEQDRLLQLGEQRPAERVLVVRRAGAGRRWCC